MKALLLLLAVWLLAAGGPVAAQIDTTRARYYQPVFGAVDVTHDVPYGAATTYTGTAQTLLLDVYQPGG